MLPLITKDTTQHTQGRFSYADEDIAPRWWQPLFNDSLK